ncbi:MAG: formylmethanofuran dehydrogenase subunit E family protein [Candidatus Muirbacterium halophilum]|nr:formylmethanofuran dehydrogenase subunit E family protein [Candidatus Muirbacterium halophilum]MCK9477318.1 formylmethanofuran dehydrogenase subunit E family protein [Candidatus Muirbacterium halophilum]
MGEIKNWDFELNDEIIKLALHFHSKPSPGTYVGVYLLKYLVSNLGEVEGKLHVITETEGCFIDVVQCILQRTMGNRYLRVEKTGFIAYTGYGRDNPDKALRVFINLSKVDKQKYPNLYGFFTGSRPHDKYDRTTLNQWTIDEFLKVGFDIFDKEWVKITGIKYKKDRKNIIVCEKCGQSFTSWEKDSLCTQCNNKDLYYQKI